MYNKGREYKPDERDIYPCHFPTCNSLPEGFPSGNLRRKYRAMKKLMDHIRTCNRRPSLEAFKCHNCNQTFPSKEELSDHVHTCDTWFYCNNEGCDRKYRQRKTAKRHIESCKLLSLSQIPRNEREVKKNIKRQSKMNESKVLASYSCCSKCGCTVESSKKDTILCKDCKTILMTSFVGEENRCVVCLDAQADHAIIPCGHANVCYECITFIKHSKDNAPCPTCRTPITQVVRLFK